MTARATRRFVLATLAAAWLAPHAHAEPDLFWRGTISSDVRLGTDEDLTFARAEARAYAKLSARLSRHVTAVGDLRLIYSETPATRTFTALTDPQFRESWRLESDALFIELRDLATDGLDVRIGRAIEVWGTADRFHAVPGMNPLDLEDPLAFGATLANEMVSVSYRPYAWLGDEDDPWLDEVGFQLVWVPFFKPARLPSSAGEAFTDDRVFSARANTPLLRELVEQRATLVEQAGWRFVQTPRITTPERTLANSQLGARARARILGVDLGLSYFRGFDDIPRASRATADASNAPSEVLVDLTLAYPRVQVLAADMATSVGFLDGMGLWAELSYTMHDDIVRVVDTGPTIGVNAVERELHAGGFVKAVVGADYTPVDWLYLNVQYLRGFVDEFGATETRDYLVAGGDIKLDYDRILIRFFNVFSLTDGSYVLHPSLVIKPWSHGQISIGALLFSSAFTGFDEGTKFDSRANPPSQVFIRASANL